MQNFIYACIRQVEAITKLEVAKFNVSPINITNLFIFILLI